VGDGSALAANSFLMKGEDVPPDSQWAGNPARETPDGRSGAGNRPPLPAEDDCTPALGRIAAIDTIARSRQ
jgi:serine acetyltransferase